jgi:hypothetical protein
LELLYDASKPNLIDFFKQNHIKEIRNTFFHSAYALHEDEYIFHDTEPIYIEGVGNSSFNVNIFFYPKDDNVILFFDAFKKCYLNSFASYTTDIGVVGNFPNPCQITLIGTPDGLKGFKIKNAVQLYGQWHDSGIWYDENLDIYAGHN